MVPGVELIEGLPGESLNPLSPVTTYSNPSPTPNKGNAYKVVKQHCSQKLPQPEIQHCHHRNESDCNDPRVGEACNLRFAQRF